MQRTHSETEVQAYQTDGDLLLTEQGSDEAWIRTEEPVEVAR